MNSGLQQPSLTKEPTAGARYLSLDHWRGFAALWVMFFHAFSGLNTAWPHFLPAWLGQVIAHGWLGVQVFFVISGYCIAERVAREYARQGSSVRFMRDRLLRIYPPYWCGLVLAIGIGAASACYRGVDWGAPGIVPHGWEWLSVPLAQAHWLGHPTYLLVAWTLSFEIGFYLLAAVGLELALRTRRAWVGWAWAGLLLVLGSIGMIGDQWPLLDAWPQFAVGGFAWMVIRSGRSPTVKLTAGGVCLAILLGLELCQPAPGGRQLPLACACSWLLIALHSWDRAIAALRALRWLGFVGGFSYSLYLVHAPILSSTSNLVLRLQPRVGPPVLFALQALMCILTLAFAWGFYRLVEANTERFRRSHSGNH